MKTQQEFYEIVKAARQRLKNLPARVISETTNDGYVREYNRLVGDEGADPEKLWSAICSTNSKSTYRRRVAATIHCCRVQLVNALHSQDAAQRAGKLPDFIHQAKTIEELIKVIDIIDKHKGLCPLDHTDRRKSKRSDLKLLPSDWRNELHKQFKGSKYELAYLVEAVSGCRPGELERGVKIICKEGGELTIRIDNGVKVTDQKGQPWREVTYMAYQNPLTSALFKMCKDTKNKQTEKIVSIENTSNWRAALSSAGQRLWPQLKIRVCPYHLRHAAASDWKRSRMCDEEISAALGHCVNKTSSIYGQFQIGTSSNGLSPNNIRAERTILETRSTVPLNCRGPAQM